MQITLTLGLRSAKAAPAIATSYLSVVWGILGSLFIFHEVTGSAILPLHLTKSMPRAVTASGCCPAWHRSWDSVAHDFLFAECLSPACSELMSSLGFPLAQKPTGQSIAGALLIIGCTGVLGFMEKKKPKPAGAAQNEQALLASGGRPDS